MLNHWTSGRNFPVPEWYSAAFCSYLMRRNFKHRRMMTGIQDYAALAGCILFNKDWQSRWSGQDNAWTSYQPRERIGGGLSNGSLPFTSIQSLNFKRSSLLFGAAIRGFAMVVSAFTVVHNPEAIQRLLQEMAWTQRVETAVALCSGIVIIIYSPWHCRRVWYDLYNL